MIYALVAVALAAVAALAITWPAMATPHGAHHRPAHSIYQPNYRQAEDVGARAAARAGGAP
jgi:hypothetical protein